MGDKPIPSEAEELDALLAELERGAAIREIAGLDTGFDGLSKALNGLRPGLYLLIGPPGCGKTAFAKQVCDQVSERDSAPALFFTFAETKRDLRVRTLARLSGLEGREIHRGSAFLLHWYGAPKRQAPDSEQLPLGWERVKRAAEEARSWLDRLYLLEGDAAADLDAMERRIREVREVQTGREILVVVDDGQRVERSALPGEDRLAIASEKLQSLAVRLELPIMATWPDLSGSERPTAPCEWAERVPAAEAVLVIENDRERTKKLTEPCRALNLHIVKNRGGELAAIRFDFHPAFSRFSEAG